MKQEKQNLMMDPQKKLEQERFFFIKLLDKTSNTLETGLKIQEICMAKIDKISEVIENREKEREKNLQARKEDKEKTEKEMDEKRERIEGNLKKNNNNKRGD